MMYKLIVTNPIDEVEIISGFETKEAAWEEADHLDFLNRYNINFSYNVVEDTMFQYVHWEKLEETHIIPSLNTDAEYDTVWVDEVITREEALRLIRAGEKDCLGIIHIGGNKYDHYVGDRSTYENGVLKMISHNDDEKDLPF